MAKRKQLDHDEQQEAAGGPSLSKRPKKVSDFSIESLMKQQELLAPSSPSSPEASAQSGPSSEFDFDTELRGGGGGERADRSPSPSSARSCKSRSPSAQSSASEVSVASPIRVHVECQQYAGGVVANELGRQLQLQQQQQQLNQHPASSPSSSTTPSGISNNMTQQQQQFNGKSKRPSTNHLLRQPICTHPSLSPFECHLDNLELWHRFHPLDTEMIITKQGR